MDKTSSCENMRRSSELINARKSVLIDKQKTKDKIKQNLDNYKQQTEVTKGVKQDVRTKRKQALQDTGTQVAVHVKEAGQAIALHKEDERSFFEPKTWFFWRGVALMVFLCSIFGHWLEIPYCFAMHELFGIVEPDYAVWSDSLWTPYWVYGAGAGILTFTMLPLKIKLVKKCKNLFIAVLAFLSIGVVACAAMECIMGWICNQPNELGEYPYWNNSVLPGNIFGQAWIVNDIALSFVSLGYVWLIYPIGQKILKAIGEKKANVVFGICCVLCAIICVDVYLIPNLFS